MQWGKQAAANATVTFPITFTSYCSACFQTVLYSMDSAPWLFRTLDTNSFSVQRYSGVNATSIISWLAIGY